MVYDEANECFCTAIKGIKCAISTEKDHRGTIWIDGRELLPEHVKALQQFLRKPTVQEIIERLDVTP